MNDDGGAPRTGWRTIPRRMLLADDTYQVLREGLVTNQLQPGARLNIEQLAKDLGVSVTPIRHALVRLEVDGLVTREPFKGYVASPMLDRATVAEIFAARLLVESHTAAEAARRATDPDVQRLASLAKNNPRESVEDEEGRAQSGDELLHRHIALVGGNKIIAEVVGGLNERLRTYRAFHLERSTAAWNPDEQSRNTMREHREIVTAIRDRDPEAAEQAMRTHLTNASQRDIDTDSGMA